MTVASSLAAYWSETCHSMFGVAVSTSANAAGGEPAKKGPQWIAQQS